MIPAFGFLFNQTWTNVISCDIEKGPTSLHPCHITSIESNPKTFVTKPPILFCNIKNSTNVDGITFHLRYN